MAPARMKEAKEKASAPPPSRPLIGVNTDYTVTRLVRMFARAGWNEGHNESFAYTEVNNSVQAGGDQTGGWWNR